MVREERVVRAVGGEEEASGDDEQKPADRVARLAPGDEDPDRRAGHSDDQRHNPVEVLVGQQQQRDHGRGRRRDQAAERRRPCGR